MILDFPLFQLYFAQLGVQVHTQVTYKIERAKRIHRGGRS